MRRNRGLIVITAVLLLTTFCGSHYTPRPRGFFRIDFPEKTYVAFDTTYPYIFEYPDICEIIPYQHESFYEPYWINIDYPMFRATLFISYKSVDNDLSSFISDSWEFVNKHIPKADAIVPNLISYPENRVYGLHFAIHGSGAASPRQFYVTDSINHFIRGALYFDLVPNNDSLKPVIEFIDSDIDRFFETLKWESH